MTQTTVMKLVRSFFEEQIRYQAAARDLKIPEGKPTLTFKHDGTPRGQRTARAEWGPYCLECDWDKSPYVKDAARQFASRFAAMMARNAPRPAAR